MNYMSKLKLFQVIKWRPLLGKWEENRKIYSLIPRWKSRH